LDATEPPRIVFASRESCSDAESSLDRAMAGARAPSRGWVVAMRVEKASRNALAAEGQVHDGGGRSIAHRVLGGVDCESLARAMGLWASLVLDAERARPRATPGDLPPPLPSSDDPANSTPAPAATGSGSPSEMGLRPRWAGRALESADDTAERADEPRREEPPTIEIGLGTSSWPVREPMRPLA
jgi:hypothetical protein